jgi:hypothetical protein
MMRPDLLVIGYFTANTGYADEVNNLRRSLVEIGLPYLIREVKNLGSWQANTHFKAEFIRQVARENPDRRLLYVDADGVFRAEPELLDRITEDLAVHYREYPDEGGKPCDQELLSGTIYFRNNFQTTLLLDRWIAMNTQSPDRWDQVNLAEAIDEAQDLLLFKLPPEYCFIFDLMRIDYPTAKPVIEHFQASRKFKHLI